MALSYNRAARRFEVAPRCWLGDGRVQFTGASSTRRRAPTGRAGPSRSSRRVAGSAPSRRSARLAIDDWSARGFPRRSAAASCSSQFLLRAGGAEMTAEGDVADMAGPCRRVSTARSGRCRSAYSRRFGRRRWRRDPRLGGQAAGSRQRARRLVQAGHGRCRRLRLGSHAHARAASLTLKGPIWRSTSGQLAGRWRCRAHCCGSRSTGGVGRPRRLVRRRRRPPPRPQGRRSRST